MVLPPREHEVGNSRWVQTGLNGSYSILEARKQIVRKRPRSCCISVAERTAAFGKVHQAFERPGWGRLLTRRLSPLAEF